MIEDPDHILLRHRAYWLSLLGSPEVVPTKKEDWQEKRVTVHLPTAILLTPQELTKMMDNIERTDTI